MMGLMKESVSCIFKYNNLYYFIKRQNFLRVFPGYFSPPGGKVDSNDDSHSLKNSVYPQDVEAKVLHTMVREIREELGYDIYSGVEREEIYKIEYLGLATTPEFNPYRFKNYYFLVSLREMIHFDLDLNEAEYGKWQSVEEMLLDYHKGEMLIVPPALDLIKSLSDHEKVFPLDYTRPINTDAFVPELESLFGVKQFLPLSHTFPPANRTNCFLIGDKDSKRILIDPSPINVAELERLINSVNQYGFDEILITHHHADHWEYSADIARRFKTLMLMSKYTFEKIGANYFKGIDVKFLKEGDVVTTSLGEDVKVFEVPGHDEGQLALAPVSMRWFLVGDLIQTIGTVVIGAPEGDMGTYFKTLKRVIELNPKYIIPSHGIIIGGTHKLKETLLHRQVREDQIKELLRKNKSLDEILEIVYVGLKTELLPYALKTIKAHIKKINEES